MLFLVYALDYPDALPKRLAARTDHVALGDKLKAEGHLLLAIPLKNQHDEMCGSVLLMSYDSEEALRTQWLQHEPYMLNTVWETIKIHPCGIGPSFVDLFSNMIS